MNQIRPIGTEIWFRTDKKCGQTDVRAGGMDGRKDRRSQNYISPTLSGDKNSRLGHDLHILVNSRVILAFGEDFIVTKLCFAKIKPSRKFPNLQ